MQNCFNADLFSTIQKYIGLVWERNMWVLICSAFLFCCVFLFGSFLFLLFMFFCVLFSVFCFSVSLFCWVSVFLILMVEKKKRYKGKNASWVYMHTNSKQTELESPGCSSFEENWKSFIFWATRHICSICSEVICIWTH